MTAHYVHGVWACVVNASRFDRLTMSTSYRDCKYNKVMEGLSRLNRRALWYDNIGDFTYDNVTASGQLRDSRVVSNKFLNGTHMVVHAAKPYAETKFDHLQVRNTFDHNQTSISPMGMRMYEGIDLHATELGTVAFIGHKAIPV